MFEFEGVTVSELWEAMVKASENLRLGRLILRLVADELVAGSERKVDLVGTPNPGEYHAVGPHLDDSAGLDCPSHPETCLSALLVEAISNQKEGSYFLAISGLALTGDGACRIELTPQKSGREAHHVRAH